MSTPYQVTIQLSTATQQSLVNSGYSLFAFHAIQATAGGQPVLWLRTASLAADIAIHWTPDYAAYVSQSQIAVNDTIAMESSAPIGYGQVFQAGQDGSFTVTNDGPPDAMSVLNTISTPSTCGLALANESVLPIAAFPLYAYSMDAMAPIEKVLLLFESYPATAGQILDRTLAQGLLVDLTGTTDLTVSFDINNGWSFGSASWGTIVPPNTSLSQVLVHQAPLQLAESVAKINASRR